MIASPIRKWYWLNGVQPDKLPTRHKGWIHPRQWVEYSEEVSFQLGRSYEDRLAAGTEPHGRLLDVSAFTHPPQEYHVCQGTPLRVVNPSVEGLPRGTCVVAGLPVEFWEALEQEASLLPPELKLWREMCLGKVIGGLYQVHHDSLQRMVILENYLTDPAGRDLPPVPPPAAASCSNDRAPRFHDATAILRRSDSPSGFARCHATRSGGAGSG